MKLSPRLILLALATVIVAGCGEPGVPVEIQFKAMVGEQPLDCESSYENQGTANTTLSFTDFRFYVHNIRLVSQSGDEYAVTLDEDGIWQQEHLALLDFENGKGTCRNGSEQMHTTLTGTVADQVFSEIRFTIGVPFDDNHVNTARAEPPLTFSNMSWGWQGGFKFLAAPRAMIAPQPLGAPALCPETTIKSALCGGAPTRAKLCEASTDQRAVAGMRASISLGFPAMDRALRTRTNRTSLEIERALRDVGGARRGRRGHAEAEA